MSQPTLSDVHISVPLTNISIAYMQDQKNFIADQVFPVLPVQHQANRYWIYTKDEWFRDDALERAPATESTGNGYNLNNASYFCHTYSHHKDIDDQIRANSDSALHPDRDATEFVTQKLLLRRERIFISKFLTPGLWTGGSGGGDQTGVVAAPAANQFLRWDLPGSTPIEDIQTQALYIASQTGRKPNTLTLGPYAALSLLNNPEVIDRVKYTQLGFLNTDLLATAFGVEKVLVPLAVYNSAAEGAPFAGQFIYPKMALLTYSPPTPSMLTPSAGYIFSWTGYLGSSSWLKIKRFRLERIESDRVEASMSFDMGTTGLDLGAYFASVVS